MLSGPRQTPVNEATTKSRVRHIAAGTGGAVDHPSGKPIGSRHLETEHKSTASPKFSASQRVRGVAAAQPQGGAI